MNMMRDIKNDLAKKVKIKPKRPKNPYNKSPNDSLFLELKKLE